MRKFYSLIITLISPFFFLRLLYRSRKAPAYRTRWSERMAIYRLPPRRQGVIWFHTVSFGEAEAVFPLIRKLQERHPHIPLLVTATTLTGSNRIRAVLGDSVDHVYLPYDLPGAAPRFLRHFRPLFGVIVETEIWPNLYRECERMHIPLAIINARLSEKSARGYRMLGRLVAQTLSHVALIAAQGPEDARRFQQIGADPKKIVVTGNLKFDYEVPQSLLEHGLKLRADLFGDRPVWIAASTHQGEEEQILDAFERIRARFANLLLILVPRRPERFGRVALLCKQRGLDVVLRSSESPCRESSAIFLLDSMGELKQFYASVDLAFIGGSLVKIGGHNALEAAALGIPVLFGPHTFNFEAISVSLVKSQAAFEVHDSFELAERVMELLENHERRNAMGQAAQAFVEANRGAMEKILALFEDYLSTQADTH